MTETQTRSGSRQSSPSSDSSNPTTDRLASMAHDTVDRVAETATQAEQEVRSAAARTAEKARHAQEQALDAADDGLQKIRAYVEKNPLASAGIAFAAGLIVSSLVRH